MLLLTQVRKLRALIKLYGHDLAVVKQQGFGDTLGDDDEKLRALALFHFNTQITDAVNEYFDTHNDDRSFLVAIAVLASAIGELLGNAVKHPELVAKARKVTKSMEAKKFAQYSKELR